MCDKELNLEELLGNCPKGTKLYSPIFGEVVLDRIEFGQTYSVAVLDDVGNMRCFTRQGKYIDGYSGETMLFPFKDQRDWSKFNIYQDGDFLTTVDNGKAFIFRGHTEKGYPAAYGGLDCFDDFIEGGGASMAWCHSPIRRATEEEIKTLFCNMEKAGYIWNAFTKRLYRDLPVGTPVLVSNLVCNSGNDCIDCFVVRKYAGNHKCYFAKGKDVTSWKTIIPLNKFKLSEDNFVQFNKEDNYGTSND